MLNVKKEQSKEDIVVKVNNKKKNLKKGTWIWVSLAAVFIVTVSIVIYFVFFNNNITGSWSKPGDDAPYTLTFKEDGVITISKESMSVDGKYNLKENNIINFDVSMNSRSFMSGDYKYKIVSNFSDKKLELIDDEGNKEEYNKCKPPEIEKLKDFSVVKPLLGKWRNDELGIEYEFYDNSIATLRKNNIMITFNYIADNQKITLKTKISGKEQESEFEYNINDNILKISGMEYIKQ